MRIKSLPSGPSGQEFLNGRLFLGKGIDELILKHTPKFRNRKPKNVLKAVFNNIIEDIYSSNYCFRDYIRYNRIALKLGAAQNLGILYAQGDGDGNYIDKKLRSIQEWVSAHDGKYAGLVVKLIPEEDLSSLSSQRSLLITPKPNGCGGYNISLDGINKRVYPKTIMALQDRIAAERNKMPNSVDLYADLILNLDSALSKP